MHLILATSLLRVLSVSAVKLFLSHQPIRRIEFEGGVRGERRCGLDFQVVLSLTWSSVHSAGKQKTIATREVGSKGQTRPAVGKLTGG